MLLQRVTRPLLSLCSLSISSVSSSRIISSSRYFSTMSSKPKVFLSAVIPQEALDLLKKECDVTEWGKDNELATKEEFINLARGKQGVICVLDNKLDKQTIQEIGDSLKAIGTISVGFDHIDLHECAARGIAVGNTPGVLTETTAELAVALLLAASRRIPEGIDAVKNGEWKHWRPLWLCGRDIYGSTVGIVGMGRIGLATARRLKAFGCDIIYSGSSAKPEAEALGYKYVDFDTLLKNSDFVSIHCPLTPKTKHLFNKETFAKMKSSAIVVNTSRGPVVDQDALYDALKNGKLFAAGLDVTTPEPLPPTHPLVSLPNCVIIPHIGSATLATRGVMAMMTVKNLLAALNNSPMPHPVKLPSV